mmetsp:Transcript_30542/g.76398  ORF Transcript_30542/g.76398 Transcript_30542/m.76398 type:complete len:532 (-) Transcript_30542:172-1767(-)
MRAAGYFEMRGGVLAIPGAAHLAAALPGRGPRPAPVASRGGARAGGNKRLRVTGPSRQPWGVSPMQSRRIITLDNMLCAASRGESEAVKVDAVLRRKVEDGIASLGYRVTVGDVAGQAGLPLADIQPVLNALASDCLAKLEVSSEGEIVYTFPPDFQAKLRGKVLRLKLEPAVDKAKGAAAYLARVSFGTALIVSVVAVWLAIYAIMNSSSNNQRSRDDRNSYASYYMTRSFFSLSDFIWYWDPYYATRAQERRAAGQEMSFLESIFSFVFGDGDPNATFDDIRWKQMGLYISQKGGVVAAEELAPFLLTSPVDDSTDESYVLPALSRFGGEVEIDDQGQILYRFPSFQVSGAGSSRQRFSPAPPAPLYEQEKKFTSASRGQIFSTVVIGILNVTGVAFLTSLLQDPSVQLSLYQSMSQSSLSLIVQGLPFLQAYGAAFFLVPVVRFFMMLRDNAGIAKRNQVRGEAAQRLKQPDAKLKRKMLSASQAAKVKVIRENDPTSFRTDRDLSPQEDRQRAAEIDRRLAELDQQK